MSKFIEKEMQMALKCQKIFNFTKNKRKAN